MKWISVEERLPPDGALVLAFLRHDADSRWDKMYVVEYSQKRSDWWIVARGQPRPNLFTVTHWMPLPERPGGTNG